jgi:redox-sensitive bicupin YhaK (pirin superfamily)
MAVEIRRGTARFTERDTGRATRHAFSFGPVYDPERVCFGPMVCHDEHLLAEGRGFDLHRHADVDIVSWVVSGSLTHTDPTGGTRTLVPGEVGHLHAGSGVEHSEIAASPQTRFVQVWLRSDPAADDEPSYQVHAVRPSPMTSALRIGAAALSVSRLPAGASVTLPTAPRLHVYVASGALLRNSLAEPLAAGDALLVTDEPGPLEVAAAVDSELLVWELPGPEASPDQTS